MTLPPISAALTGRAAPAATAARPAPARPEASPALKKAASEFEGMLISTLWKGLLDDPMGGLDSEADPGSGSIQSLGLQAMSTAISASGGLGLAKMVERQLAPHPQPANPAAAPLQASHRLLLRPSLETQTSLKLRPAAADKLVESRPQAPPAGPLVARVASGNTAPPLSLSAAGSAIALDEKSGGGE